MQDTRVRDISRAITGDEKSYGVIRGATKVSFEAEELSRLYKSTGAGEINDYVGGTRDHPADGESRIQLERHNDQFRKAKMHPRDVAGNPST